MFGLLPAFLGGAVGGLPTAPRRRGLQADMSRLGMHVRRVGPVVYIPGTLVTYAADTFDRADGATLGTSSGGQTWVTETSATGIALSIVSNRAAKGASFGMQSVDVAHAAYTASVKIKPSSTTYPGDGLTFRGNDFTNCFRFAFNDPGVPAFFRKVAGTETQVNVGSGYANDGSTEYTLSVTVDGSNNITCKINGTTVYTVTDSSFSSNTMVGMEVTGASTLNDFLVTS